MENLKITPFLKWAGGKRQLLPVIRAYLPEEFKSKTIKRFIEPFVGGGAVFFYLIQRYEFQQVVLNDYNKELINLYLVVKNDIDLLVKELEIISEEYLALNEKDRKTYYLTIREKYNSAKNNSIKKAVYLMFLNKTCFNGLYRVNKKNQFNVPHGRYKNPTILNEGNLRGASRLLQNTDIFAEDFEHIREHVDDKTFVYFDPPYRPLNASSSFTSYSNNEFNDEEQVRLANFFYDLDKKGAKLMLSNSDPKNTDREDNFFDELYNGFNIYRVGAKRSINSNSDKRGEITELLITNY